MKGLDIKQAGAFVEAQETVLAFADIRAVDSNIERTEVMAEVLPLRLAQPHRVLDAATIEHHDDGGGYEHTAGPGVYLWGTVGVVAVVAAIWASALKWGAWLASKVGYAALIAL